MSKLELQKKVDEIIKTSITPILKNMGFKKSGRNYYKPFSHYGICFNIQSSLYNHEEEVRFTFNTGIALPEVYELVYDRSISKFPKEYECVRRKRIGKIKGTEDLWYSLSEKTNIIELIDIIRIDLENYIKPYFESFKDDNSIFEILNKEKMTSAPYEQVFLSGFYILYGNKEAGERMLIQHYLSIEGKEQYKENIEKVCKALTINLEIFRAE